MSNRIRLALRALRHRNLRLFFVGQGISLVGTWMQQVAMSWLVYRLTDSAFLLGVIGFSSQFPSLLMAPFAGALADRWSRYRMVAVAQTLAMVQAVVLAALVIGGLVQVWHLVVLAVVVGVINGVDIPARQALLVKLVEGQADLPNAIALNSSMFNAARLIGPALGGILIGWWGEGPVFVLNAVSFVGILGALAMMRLPAERGLRAGALLQNIREGFGYAFGFAPIRDLLVVLAGVSLLGIPYVVLFPVFARDILDGDATTLGLLTASSGAGALAGALYLASRDTVMGLGRVIAGALALFGTTLLVFSVSRSLLLSCAMLALGGFGLMLTTASINTVVQTLVGEEMRGRVMSLYTMAFMGMMPIGSLGGGAIASRIGAPAAVALGGMGCLVFAAWFVRRIGALRAQVLPVYEQRGVIPEVARGIQVVSELRPRS
ncbi:MAG: MFS transporter [Gemmatimonadota bacterium]|nr:MFS transporter [Gemmatimonadota bacterium]